MNERAKVLQGIIDNMLVGQKKDAREQIKTYLSKYGNFFPDLKTYLERRFYTTSEIFLLYTGISYQFEILLNE